MARIGRYSRAVAVTVLLVTLILLTLRGFVASQPLRRYRSAISHNASNVESVYDFIVVGGGQSGLTVANRLSEDGKSTVLVIEYGHLYRDDPLIARPWRPFNASAGDYHDPKLMYNYSSVPQVALNDRRTPVSAAATVGGGSTVNGMLLNRGSREDYDAWEKLGNPGWGWRGLLPYFKKSVTFTPPGEWLQKEYGATYDTEAAYGIAGGNGSIHASNPSFAWPGQKVQIAGWKELGIKQSNEGAGGDAFGIFWVPRAQNPKDQTRSYAVSGHLDSALRRPNFDLQVLFKKEWKADAVVVQSRFARDKRTIRAKKEIILAAGLHSPLILQRSGIGPREVLEAAKIPLLVDLPGVGMNLQDHPAAGLLYDFTTNLPYNPSNMSDPEFAAEADAEFETKRTGPFAGGHNTVAFLPTADFASPSQFLGIIEGQTQGSESDYLPSIYESEPTLRAGFAAQRELLERALVSRNSTQVEIPVAGDNYALIVLQKPFSRGTITVDPENPMDGGPLVDFNTMRNPVDLEIMIAMMKFTRKWFGTEAMSTLGPVEQWPGYGEEDEEGNREDQDERLRGHVRGNAESGIGHESGTCAMLPLDKGGVVGPDLLVHKLQGLSVVDASIMPLIPSTNLCATVYAVAEKAADIIRQRHSIRTQFIVQ